MRLINACRKQQTVKCIIIHNYGAHQLEDISDKHIEQQDQCNRNDEIPGQNDCLVICILSFASIMQQDVFGEHRADAEKLAIQR